MWKKTLLVDTKATANEGELFEDLDGDGIPEWIVNSWKKPSPQYIWRLSIVPQKYQFKVKGVVKFKERMAPVFKKVVINKTGNGHGFGCG